MIQQLYQCLLEYVAPGYQCHYKFVKFPGNLSYYLSIDLLFF